MIFFKAIITIVAGYSGAAILGLTLNWPDAGAIVAIAVMGAMILYKLEQIGNDE